MVGLATRVSDPAVSGTSGTTAAALGPPVTPASNVELCASDRTYMVCIESNETKSPTAARAARREDGMIIGDNLFKKFAASLALINRWFLNQLIT